jgi:hypothetical protein
MFGNKSKGTITFYYNSDELFNDVSLLSAFMTKNIVVESGSSLDEFAITDDEKEVFEVCVKQALPAIYETMIKITSGIDSAFNNAAKVQKKEEEGLLREEGTYIEFTIKDNGAYNKNILNLVDATLLECLKYGVLAEFYSICVNGGLLKLSQEKFVANMLQLKQRLFQLKKRTTSTDLI